MRERIRVLDVSGLPTYAYGHRSLMWWGTFGMILIESTVFALAVGTWCDKLIFWFMPGHGLPISRHLAYFPAYDVPAALHADYGKRPTSWMAFVQARF